MPSTRGARVRIVAGAFRPMQELQAFGNAPLRKCILRPLVFGLCGGHNSVSRSPPPTQCSEFDNCGWPAIPISKSLWGVLLDEVEATARGLSYYTHGQRIATYLADGGIMPAKKSSPKASARRSSSHGSKTLTDHETIQEWAEERGATPACVRKTGGKGDVGMIRLDFPGYSGEESLQPISWDDWFEKFDENNLALLVQETTAGGQESNFNKLIKRSTAEESEHRPRTRTAR